MTSKNMTESDERYARFNNVHAFLAAWLGEAFDAMDAMIYFIVLVPCLSDLLKTTDATQIGWHSSIILAMFMVGWAIGSILFGVLADLYGRRMAMTSSIVLYAIASALCAASQNWEQLAFFRLLVGCGIGGEISLGGVLLSEAWKGKGRIWALCLMQSSFSFGCLFSGMLNMSVGGAGGWRWLFLIGLAPAMVAYYIRSQLSEPQAFELLKEYRKRLAQRPKETLEEAEHDLLAQPLRPLLKGNNLRNLLICTTLCMSAIVGYWAAISWIPAWINQLVGNEAVLERSTAITLLSVGGIIACFICPLITARLGRRKTFIFGFVGSLLSVLALFMGIHAYGPLLLVATGMVGFFSNIPFIVVTFYIPELFETHLLGTAAGISWSAGRIGAAIAGLATGPIIAAFNGSYAHAASCVSLIYLAGLLASFFVGKTKGVEPLTEDELSTATIDSRSFYGGWSNSRRP